MAFEKKSHHYVPQYWQRGFRGTGNHLYGRDNSGHIRIVSPKSIMQGDWLYTLFDDHWNPSDALEDALSVMEAEDAQLFRHLHAHGHVAGPGDRVHLCRVLALQASRHPDVLGRGHRRSRELGALLARTHAMTLPEFQKSMSGFGVSEPDAHDCYIILRSRTQEQLASELAALQALSPQSSQLPEQEALLAAPLIQTTIEGMTLVLLDAPAGEAFVLGDTPLPQSGLQRGFSVPLSCSLAVQAMPAGTPQHTLARRPATPAEVRDINRAQADSAREIVIGPSAALLAGL